MRFNFSFVVSHNNKTNGLQELTTLKENQKIEASSNENVDYLADAEKVYISITPSTEYTDSLRNAVSEDEWP